MTSIISTQNIHTKTQSTNSVPAISNYRKQAITGNSPVLLALSLVAVDSVMASRVTNFIEFSSRDEEKMRRFFVNLLYSDSGSRPIQQKSSLAYFTDMMFA